MNKRITTFFAVACLMLSGCQVISPSDSASSESTENNVQSVYVLPTKKGQKYLKQNSLKSYIDIRRDDDDKSYHMVIDNSAFESGTVSFHNSSMGSYTYDNIDVQLFGIGTNFNNSSTAETVLYASLDEDAEESNSESTNIDLKDNLDDSGSSEGKTIVTGVEYVYGTGPLMNVLNTEQNVWIKTTAMEYDETKGAYVTSKDIEPTYTSVYIELTDTVAPVISPINAGKTYSDYVTAKSNGTSIADWVWSILSELVRDKSASGSINSDEIPTINSVEIDNAKDSYVAGDTITGKYSAKDSAGNISNEQTFRIPLTKDYDDESEIKIPYREITKHDNDYRENYLKEQILTTFKNGAFDGYLSKLTASDISLTNFDDDMVAKMSDSKVILGKEIVKVAAKIENYGTFEFNIVMSDIYAPKVKFTRFDRTGLKAIDELIEKIKDNITITDDFEDSYRLKMYVRYVESNDFYSYEGLFSVLDSSSNSNSNGIPTQVIVSSEELYSAFATEFSDIGGTRIYNI